MKKLTLTIFSLIFFLFSSSSQPCLPEGIVFHTQSQIDNFQANYPHCNEIEGDVLIQGPTINNLNGLSVLTSIGESLMIYGNNMLPNLTGLNNITYIGGDLEIYNNSVLTNLTGLEGLTHIEGDFINGHYNIHAIFDNPNLNSLTGLDSLTSTDGDLWIFGNDALTDLSGSGNLISIGGDNFLL